MRPQIFGQDADILASRAGTTAGTVRERCRPYKLGGLGAHNESSSARLGRSQKLKILPSPNSKSLGAYFLMDAYIFDRCRDFNVRLVTVVYYVAHLFWKSADILDMRIYFEHVHIS
jgi:hypothetical protein